MRLAAAFALSILWTLRLHAGTIGWVYNNGVMSAIPGVTAAAGVNNAGQIVGDVGSFLEGDVSVGFLLSNGILTTFSVPGSTETQARAINNNGQIVGGWGVYPDLFAYSFSYSNGVFTTLNVPVTQNSPNSYAMGVNDQGDIVGFYSTCNSINCVQHGYLYSNGFFTTLDAPGAYSTFARGINYAGQIVGYYQAASDYSYHGFLYANGQFTTIDGPDGRNTALTGINNRGAMVGYYLEGHVKSFVDDNGVFSNFVFPGADYSFANDINDSGLIVGHAIGNFRTASPEAGSWKLMAAGIGALALLAQRRKSARTSAQSSANRSS